MATSSCADDVVPAISTYSSNAEQRSGSTHQSAMNTNASFPQRSATRAQQLLAVNSSSRIQQSQQPMTWSARDDDMDRCLGGEQHAVLIREESSKLNGRSVGRINSNPLFDRVASERQAMAESQVKIASSPSASWTPRGLLDGAARLVKHEMASMLGSNVNADVPRRLRRWFPFLTVLTSLVCIFVYVYMVAQWPGYRLEYCRTFPNHHLCDLNELTAQAPLGPMAAWKTLALGETPYFRFDGDFIIAWGARYSPMLRYERGQWWRWVTSFYVHLSRGHIIGNLTLYIPLGGLLEWRFGPFRFLFVLVVTIIGGNMFSALLEKECYFYAGASSGVYGVVGMQLADAFYNFDRTMLPLVRTGFTLFMIAQNVYQELYQDVPVSAMSHIGSCIMGFFCGFLVMMTHIPPSKWQLVVGIVGLMGLVVGTIWLPLAVYGEVDFFSHSPFKNSTHQCCYNPPQYDSEHYGHGYDPVCRTFPRPEALQALPVKYNLPLNQSWWVTGKAFSQESVDSMLQLKANE